MSAVKSTNNRAEVLLRKELWRRGFRYRLYDRRLPGRPDLVFWATHTAIFVDGDYWHGRALVEGGMRALRAVFRTSRREFWVAKISLNVQRDLRTTETLRGMGWRVVRIWESDVLSNPPMVAEKIVELLSQGSG